jgi:hypothetical protein
MLALVLFGQQQRILLLYPRFGTQLRFPLSSLSLPSDVTQHLRFFWGCLTRGPFTAEISIFHLGCEESCGSWVFGGSLHLVDGVVVIYTVADICGPACKTGIWTLI